MRKNLGEMDTSNMPMSKNIVDLRGVKSGPIADKDYDWSGRSVTHTPKSMTSSTPRVRGVNGATPDAGVMRNTEVQQRKSQQGSTTDTPTAADYRTPRSGSTGSTNSNIDTKINLSGTEGSTNQRTKIKEHCGCEKGHPETKPVPVLKTIKKIVKQARDKKKYK